MYLALSDLQSKNPKTLSLLSKERHLRNWIQLIFDIFAYKPKQSIDYYICCHLSFCQTTSVLFIWLFDVYFRRGDDKTMMRLFNMEIRLKWYSFNSVTVIKRVFLVHKRLGERQILAQILVRNQAPQVGTSWCDNLFDKYMQMCPCTDCLTIRIVL